MSNEQKRKLLEAKRIIDELLSKETTEGGNKNEVVSTSSKALLIKKGLKEELRQEFFNQ